MASLSKRTVSGYRIADIRSPIFSGEGAEKIGGRWNMIGKAVIYASLNLSLAMLEQLVHLNGIATPPTRQYVKITSIEEILIEEVDIEDFKTWDIYDISETQEYGSNWIDEMRSLALLVPSIIVPQEKNLLLNPKHHDIGKLHISEPQDIQWDSRLF